MRLSESASVSSSKIRNSLSPNSRARKKRKRLDAICEKTYNLNRGIRDESNDGNVGEGVDSELRRSTRVRRAPVLLDVSPAPAKKRQKNDKREKRNNGVKSCSPKSEDEEDEEEKQSGWRTRLRSRGRNAGFRGKGKGKEESPRGKRKLFNDMDEVKEETMLEIGGELGGEEEGLEGGKSTVVKSKRPGRIKASKVLWVGEKEIELNSPKEDDNERNEVEVLGNDDSEEDHLDLKVGTDGGNEGENVDSDTSQQLVEKVESDNPNDLQIEEGGCIANGNVETVEQIDKLPEQGGCVANGNVETVEQIDMLPEQLEHVKEGENQGDTVEVGGMSTSQLEGHDDKGAPSIILGDKPLEYDTGMKVNKSDTNLSDKLSKTRIKEGRRCGLCGGGTDGKPPKRLVNDTAESENEAFSGSSASEEPSYDIWDGFGDEPGWLGRLLGPINDRYGIAGIWVHQHCAVWSPEVYFAGLGCLKNVRAALCRGRALKCSLCGRRGATIGCRVDRCPKTYHLPCARAAHCIFDHRKFLIACMDHRNLFQPHGDQYLYRIKKMKAKKMKLDLRKVSNDAWRKDLESEEKWLENCGEDEEFLKRESKRLHRDILRIAPVFIGGPDSESEKLFQGWESVAGLQDVIRCMKEVVILPLLYPEFFTNLGLTPPRGVLLHGYPGTGKTLVVRALIGSCARGDKRIAYFARKGADCLGKYVGDAERQLRLLFQVAEKSQPSIIFFDEIDGLAPRRTRQQDQTHSSVVSTLLALLDGLKSRGSVVVIGATNRPEAVDPALRRPGRFDREIYFPLPSVKDRAAILSLHTQKWPKPVAGSLLKWIAKRTAGFAGADLQALCTQVAVIALKRNCPLHKLLSAATEKAPDGNRVPLPAFVVEERDWLEALSCAPPPCSQREAGMAANDVVSSPLPAHLISCLLQPLSSLLVSLYLDERLFLPPPLSKAAMTIKKVIVAALDKKKVPSDCWWAHVKNLLQEAEVGQEIEREFACAGILIRDATYAGSNLLNDDGNEKVEVSKVHDGYRSSLLRNTYHASGKNSGFRILIAGSPRSGQRHLASCILHCFVGNVEIQKVDLATISQEGRGDVLQGITQILMKCSSVGSCVVFMPRIDLWAINTCQQDDEKESDSCSTNHQLSEMESCLQHGQDPEKENDSSPNACESVEDATPEDTIQKASLAWSSFIEQVDSICMSTSLMILATSEKPYQELPIRIRKFFNIDISNCNEPTPEYTVPRFSVQADGNFNRDVVIISSSAKLSRDVIQQFVQLIHHRTHTITSSCGEYKTCNTFESDPDVVCHGTDVGSANQHEFVTHPAKDSLVKAPLPPNNRFEKGKSNLLLAISTFGYQILRYPHFSELCWVTSKLKEGPCTDINGPWKGWPFNSCIVRPDNSEKIDDASSSNNLKSKEKPGVVRGLVAVGLSAYRGVYASLREVSLEVRKVFELLVLQINAKIGAGKAKHQFVRILSQVAYLEDVVNSWAYTLQSLEQDARVTGANPQPSTVRSSDDHNMRANNLVQGEECKLDVPMRSAHELVGLEENPHKLAPENNECVDLRNGDDGFPNLNVKVQMPERGPPHQMVLDHSDPNNTHLQNSPTAAAELCTSENTGNHTMESGDFGSLKYSNGFATKESAAISEDGPSSSDGPVGIKLSRSSEVCNQNNGFSLMKAGFQSEDGNSKPKENVVSLNKSTSGFQSEDGNSKPKENVVSLNKSTSVSAAAQAVCLYGCCAQCLHAIHGLMQKILMHEWKLNGNSTTVEDVHEVVATLSMNLLSALRKDYVAKDFSNSFEEIPSYQNRGKLFELQERHGTCQQCRNSENKLFTPVNCSCHSMSGSSDNQNTSPIPQLELDTRFIYRDGVLAPVDPVKDLSFHCKFETLCLCSLIDWIAMTQKSLD